MNPIPSSEPITNLTFDELPLGARARISRTLTQDDIVAFALVSGDVNPAHVDPEYANATRFHGTIAHGMWAGAMISSLLGTEFPGPGTIYEGQTLRFHLPVRAGDTLTTVWEITDLTPKPKHDGGIVAMKATCSNQDGEAVAEATGTMLVKNAE